MWSLVIVLCLTTWVGAQNGRGSQHDNGHGWDIRLAVPGEPGNDYPTLGAIPRTSFSCAGRDPGYYADIETNCQVFRVCTIGSTYGFQSFLCPNGTLFNQAVFVCDWWMNVNCKNSEQLIKKNNEKFENLRLGPQLMKDVKKMLTHPMLNPYDKNAMKSNRIVMQDYKPPVGQLFPNGALLAGPERPPNNVYVPSKQIQQNFIQSSPNDYTFSASTPNPQYLPPPVNNNFGYQSDDDYLQRQRQLEPNPRTGRYRNIQNGNVISNSHVGRYVQNPNTDINRNAFSKVSQTPRPTQVSNFGQRQTNTAQISQAINVQNNNSGIANRQRAQYAEARRLQPTNEKQTDFGVTITKPQNNQNSNNNQDKPYSYSTPSSALPQFSGEINGKTGRELKENLVSTQSTIKSIPTTVVTKTPNRSEKKIAKPKSRVTIKTWIIKPTKSARQLVDPTPYTYSRSPPPSPSPTERLIADTTPYLYERPTEAQKIRSSELEAEEPYIYAKPTVAAKQIRTTEIETTRIYLAPTTNPTRPTFLSRLNLPSNSPLPTKASRYYLAPSPFKATDRLYLPPPRNPTSLPRLYLSPNTIAEPVFYQSSQLRASPTMPSPTFVSFNEILNQPSFSLTEQSRMNANHNNLSFTDILTKEKLDITVNDIVKDTDNILKTASPPQQNQYFNNLQSLDYTEGYVSNQPTTDSGERLTSLSPLQSTTTFLKSSRLVATPATSLVPPDESFMYHNTNQLSKLPFYKESGLPNTIERTVSIKITIPERVAVALFKNHSEADYDKLEILNTGSSNYLVLSNNNNLWTKKNANFIPIAKLSGNNNMNNISDSQALVYSFLTDSINVAREYTNIAQQEILTSTATPTPAQFQNLNNEQLSDITNKISQLTSSQFSSNNFNSIGKSANLISTQSTNINQPIQFTGHLKQLSEQHQARQLQNPQYNAPSQPTQKQFYSAQYQTPNTKQNLLSNQNIYSGQLYQWPVPEVTSQIYNRPANLVNPNTIQQTTQMLTLQRNTNQNNADSLKQSSPDFEIIKAETLPFSPAKLQLDPNNKREHFTSQESLANLLNSGDGISAQLQDKIVGTIPHPLEENKLVTYKKDQSYYLYSKLDDNTIDQNLPSNTESSTNTQQNTKTIESNTNPNLVTFQLIPSVNYELDDEKEQAKILNAFQIDVDEFGAPRAITKLKTKNEGEIMTSSVDFSVEHPTSSRRSDRYRVDPIYSGPSSYTAPQSSVGSLENRQSNQNNFNSRLEDLDSINNENGYPKDRPARQFRF